MAKRKGHVLEESSAAEETRQIVVLLDRSWSMEHQREQVIEALNVFLENLKTKVAEDENSRKVEYLVGLYVFSDALEGIFNAPLHMIGPVTSFDYRVGGATALYDCVEEILRTTMSLKEDGVHRTLVIATDGMDTSSKRIRTTAELKEIMQNYADKYQVEYIFLAEGLDACETGKELACIPENSDYDYSMPLSQRVALAAEEVFAKSQFSTEV